MMNREDLLVRKHYARYRGLNFPVAIGRGGIGEKQKEGDSITPIGTWEIEEWRIMPARVRLNYTPSRPQDIWIDDSDSDQYNQLASRPTNMSHERMFRADHLYDIVGITNYNRNPAIQGKGSAIFVHQWRKPRHPTEGCVAFPRPVLEFIAKTWSPRAKIIIQG